MLMGWVTKGTGAGVEGLGKIRAALPDLLNGCKFKDKAPHLSKVHPFLDQIISGRGDGHPTFVMGAHKI